MSLSLVKQVHDDAARLTAQVATVIGDPDRPLEDEIDLLERAAHGAVPPARAVEVEEAANRFAAFLKLSTGLCAANFDDEFWRTEAGTLLASVYVWLYGDAMPALREKDDYSLEDVMGSEGDLIDLTTAYMLIKDIRRHSEIRRANTAAVAVHQILYPRKIPAGGPGLTSYYTPFDQFRARVRRSEVLARKSEFQKP